MPGTIHSSISKSLRTPNSPRPPPINKPFSHLSRTKRVFPAPCHTQRPPLSPDVVADQVVYANEDEDGDAALEEGGDVVCGGVEDVADLVELGVDLEVEGFPGGLEGFVDA
jgi:hypothetical protein